MRLLLRGTNFICLFAAICQFGCSDQSASFSGSLLIEEYFNQRDDRMAYLTRLSLIENGKENVYYALTRSEPDGFSGQTIHLPTGDLNLIAELCLIVDENGVVIQSILIEDESLNDFLVQQGYVE